MAETNIEWCDYTFNFVRGCRKKSAGCAHCYAETMSGRNPAVLGEWGPDAKRVFAVESYWKQLARWNRKAKVEGRIARVFVASLADVFEGEPLPGGKEGTDGPRADYLPHLERLVRETSELQNLRILVLTKRPENMLAWVRARGEWPWNWWAGTSVEDQKAADERVPLLCQVPAPVRFLSMEPLLGPADLNRIVLQEPTEEQAARGKPPVSFSCLYGWFGGVGNPSRIAWAIVGGESGSKVRPMHPDWVRSIRDQCVEAGVPFMFKQWGAWAEADAILAAGHLPHDWLDESAPDTLSKTWWDAPAREAFARRGKPAPTHPIVGDTQVFRVGKKTAGRMLDGRTWDQVPEVNCG